MFYHMSDMTIDPILLFYITFELKLRLWVPLQDHTHTLPSSSTSWE